MATVDDRWMTKGPDGKKTVRTPRYGKGKRWSVRWRDAAGDWHRESFTARDAADQRRAELDAGGDATALDRRRGQTTVLDYARRWTKARKPEPATAEWYRFIVEGRVRDRWGAVAVATVTQAQVQDWLGELLDEGGLSASRVRAHHTVLAGALQHAVDDRAIASNPAQARRSRHDRVGVQLPARRKQRAKHLDPAVLARVIWALETGERVADPTRRVGSKPAADHSGSDPTGAVEDVKAQRRAEVAQKRRAATGELKACFALVMAFGGLRFGEAAALDVGDLQGRRLHVERGISTVSGRQLVGDTKSHRDRYVVLPVEVAERLYQLAAGRPAEAPLLPAAKGGRWHYGVWRKAWRTACELDATTHSLRHTAASLAIRARADLKVLQQMLGHASATLTLDTYGHLYEDQLDGVADRLSEFVPRPLRVVDPVDAEEPSERAAGE